jgi:diaminopimelate decarboxylase
MNTELLNPLKLLYEGAMVERKNRGDESICVIIHIHMEMSQGNSLHSYLKQTKMLFFSFTKLENQRVEQVLPGGGGPVVGRRR